MSRKKRRLRLVRAICGLSLTNDNNVVAPVLVFSLSKFLLQRRRTDTQFKTPSVSAPFFLLLFLKIRASSVEFGHLQSAACERSVGVGRRGQFRDTCVSSFFEVRWESGTVRVVSSISYNVSYFVIFLMCVENGQPVQRVSRVSRTRPSATFTPSAHLRRQSLPVWPPTLNDIPLPSPNTTCLHVDLHYIPTHNSPLKKCDWSLELNKKKKKALRWQT